MKEDEKVVVVGVVVADTKVVAVAVTRVVVVAVTKVVVEAAVEVAGIRAAPAPAVVAEAVIKAAAVDEGDMVPTPPVVATEDCKFQAHT